MFSKHCGGQKSARRRLLTLGGVVLFVYVALRIGLSFVPSGYRDLECINTDETLWKQEKLLETFVEIAAKHNFSWWADYGMLLGAVRSGHLLPWDKDMDAAFLVEDHDKFQALRPALQEHGLDVYGVTVCYKEDLPKMELDSELVVARLEFFPMVSTDSGLVIRADLKSAVEDRSVKGWIWWKLLVWTMTTNFEYASEMFPLGDVTLRHPPAEMLAARKPSEPVSASEDEMRQWRLKIPAPKDAPKYLERLYGKSWSKPMKWKLTCYM